MSTRLAAWPITKAPGDGVDLDMVRQKANVLAGLVAKTPVTLLAQMGENGTVRSWVVVAQSRKTSGGQLAIAAADAVNANAGTPEDLPDLDCSHVMRASARRGQVPLRETQAGQSVQQVAETFSRAAREGDWMAVTMCAPKAKQQRAIAEFMDDRGASTHHSRGASARVACITTGGPDDVSARATMLQMLAVAPGFDVAVQPKRAGLGAGAWCALVLGILAVVGGIAGGVTFGAIALGAALLSWFVCALLGRVPTARGAQAKAIRRGHFPAPDGSAVFKAKQRPQKVNSQGAPIPASTVRPIDYPLSRYTFAVGPEVVIGLVATSTGSSSGVGSTAARPVPESLREAIGPRVGTGAGDQPAHLSCGKDLQAGVLVVGERGSGKSVLVRLITGWLLAQKMRDTSVPGAPGRRCGMVVFENKGDGADYVRHWARGVGHPGMLRMDLADPSTPAIDMFGGPGSVADRSRRFVSAAQYAFGDDAIGMRAVETFQMVIPAALILSEIEKQSVISLAHRLCGGNGYEDAVRLAAMVSTLADERTDAADAHARFQPLFGPKITQPQHRDLTASSRNKFSDLRNVDTWFDPSRPHVSWHSLLEGHEDVVLNLGSTPGAGKVDSKLTAEVSAMLTYLLRDAIEDTCLGWQAQGRSTTIVADELKLLAASSADVIEWLQEQGRAAGVRLVFATQWLDQLPDGLRASVKGFGNAFWLRQENADVIAQAVADVNVSAELFTTADVAGLANYTCLARIRRDGRRQPVFTMSIGHWESDTFTDQAWEPGMTRFLIDQNMTQEPGVASALDREWVHGADPGDDDEPDGCLDNVWESPVDLTKSGAVIESAAGARLDPNRFGGDTW